MRRGLLIAGVAVTVLVWRAGAAGAATRWVIQRPSPVMGGSALFGVSCLSPASRTAVGARDAGTLAESWDGSTWAIQAVPSAAGATEVGLNGISCVSRTNCTAVGSSDHGPLAEYWNGGTWAIQPTPVPSGSAAQSLAAVSCALGTSCTAVGQYFRNNYHGLFEAR